MADKNAKEVKDNVKNKTLSVEDLQEFEAGQGVDVSEFEGRQTQIEGIEFKEVESDYTEDGEYVEGLGRKKMVMRVFSVPVTEIEDSDGNKIAIRASEIFNLKQVEGQWGVSTSDNAKVNKFLKKLKLPSGMAGVKALQKGGQKVIMRTTGKNSNFLGFVY